MERAQDSGGSEKQYKELLEQIQSIYENAKEFHSKVHHIIPPDIASFLPQLTGDSSVIFVTHFLINDEYFPLTGSASNISVP